MDNLTCKYCNKLFKHKRSLTHHLKIHESKLTCEKCQKDFSRSDKLIKHMNTCKGKTESHKCDICQKVFSQKMFLNWHLNTHNEKPEMIKIAPYFCERCNIFFNNRSLFVNHKLTHGNIILDHQIEQAQFSTDINNLIRENHSIIFIPNQISEVMSIYNLPLLSFVGDAKNSMTIYNF